MPKNQILKHIPWPDVVEMMDDLVEAGCDADTAIQQTADILDALLPLDVLVPDPALGAVLESVDGVVIKAALRLIWGFAQNADLRKARRQSRKIARQARREAKS